MQQHPVADVTPFADEATEDTASVTGPPDVQTEPEAPWRQRLQAWARTEEGRLTLRWALAQLVRVAFYICRAARSARGPVAGAAAAAAVTPFALEWVRGGGGDGR